MTEYGIDVSHYQAPASLDWQRFGAECRFVIVRAAYGTFIDPSAPEHFSRARDVGLQLGLYHFYRSTVAPQAQAEALFAAATKAGYDIGDVIPAIDIEDDPHVAAITPAWLEPLQAFVALVAEHFRCPRPMLYITQRDFGRLGKPAWVLEHPLWVAHYTAAREPATPGNAPWVIWQHRVGPFDPAGPGGYFTPALLDQDRANGALPLLGSTPPDAGADPDWLRLRASIVEQRSQQIGQSSGGRDVLEDEAQ